MAHHDQAEVARSTIKGPSSEGQPSAIGFVPNTASVELSGATYSGLWHMITPTRPASAICSTQCLCVHDSWSPRPLQSRPCTPCTSGRCNGHNIATKCVVVSGCCAPESACGGSCVVNAHYANSTLLRFRYSEIGGLVQGYHSQALLPIDARAHWRVLHDHCWTSPRWEHKCTAGDFDDTLGIASELGPQDRLNSKHPMSHIPSTVSSELEELLIQMSGSCNHLDDDISLLFVIFQRLQCLLKQRSKIAKGNSFTVKINCVA